MYTYFEAKTAVRVGSELTEDFEVKVGVHQGAPRPKFSTTTWLLGSKITMHV